MLEFIRKTKQLNITDTLIIIVLYMFQKCVVHLMVKISYFQIFTGFLRLEFLFEFRAMCDRIYLGLRQDAHYIYPFRAHERRAHLSLPNDNGNHSEMVQLCYRSFTNISLPTARDFQPKFYGLFFDDVLFFLQIFLLS